MNHPTTSKQPDQTRSNPATSRQAHTESVVKPRPKPAISSLSSRPTSNASTASKPSSSGIRPTSSNYASKKPVSSSATVPSTSKTSISKKLKIPNVDDKLVEFILDEIVDSGQTVKFDDVGKKSNQV